MRAVAAHGRCQKIPVLLPENPAGIGGGFTNTKELHVMKYNDAMAGNEKKEWEMAVKEEHERMLKHEVFENVAREKVPEGAKILTAKWDGDPNFEFVVSGRSESDYAKDPERRRSVSGYSTFLCGAPVTMKSRMQG